MTGFIDGIYGKGDDEFPAETKIRYDKFITAHLASDIIHAPGVGICERLERQ
ncbi:hypothetical protein [Desulforapulum autotrophicum]|jgi:hypothetical protein|uniref:hypothetical protein n=1 Tax=Desulforapulum autotrophicum TaxID=2296 RepID=UPI0002E23F07|nr:hypothetical protein [Desulforapulum autotrophicum]